MSELHHYVGGVVIESVAGDIIAAPVEMIINPVNCIGVMGRGLALQVRRVFPGCYAAYTAACARGEVAPGTILITASGRLAPRWVAHLPTKRHWRDRSRLDDIRLGLSALAVEIESRGVRSVAVPALGCGLGGLTWSVVRPEIERALSRLDAQILVYEPG